MQKEILPAIDELLAFANISRDEIDWYLFHQPNKFMVEKLAQRMKVDITKMPSNIVENFSNSSGSCVGVNITYNLGNDAKVNKYKCCLSAFGGDLAWSSAVIDIGNLAFNEMLITNL